MDPIWKMTTICGRRNDYFDNSNNSMLMSPGGGTSRDEPYQPRSATSSLSNDADKLSTFESD